jgi:predicted nuclease of predicted toxin-antitoxin system
MPSEGDLHRRSITLGRMARVLLTRVERVKNREQKRRIAQQAFTLAQEAVALRVPGYKRARRSTPRVK